MDPDKDIGAYGYGSVAWKTRMEKWRNNQGDKLQIATLGENSLDGDDPDNSDLPM